MTSAPNLLPVAHQEVLDKIVRFFRSRTGAVGGSVSGSVARGIADEYSDLDVGIFFADADAREAAWASRWEWEIAPWFHRFEADHVKPYMVIYLYEPVSKPTCRSASSPILRFRAARRSRCSGTRRAR